LMLACRSRLSSGNPDERLQYARRAISRKAAVIGRV